MKGTVICVLMYGFLVHVAFGQARATLVFAHNDYEHAKPFLASYESRADYVEADIFLKKGKLYVAHTASGISEDRTLNDLYLEPIEEMIVENEGRIYPELGKTLTLMVDLKTDGPKTLDALSELLQEFPRMIECRSLTIAISGNVPPATEWSRYPAFIHFDGRPTITYTNEQLSRVALISASFRDYSSWNGRGEMSNDDRLKLESVVSHIHALGKPARFWAAPDFSIAWKMLINLGVDVINTDDVEGAVMFVRQQ